MLNKIAAFNNPLLQRIITYAISDGLSKAIPFLVFPFVAIYLTSEEFGIVANFSVLTQVMLAFTLLNGHTYLTVEFYKINEEERSRLVSNILLVPLVHVAFLSILIFFFSEQIFRLTKIPPFWQMTTAAWTAGMAIIYIYQSLLRLEEKARSFARLQVFQASLSAALTLLLVILLQYGLEGRLSSLVLSIGIVGLYSLFRLTKTMKIGFKPEKKWISQLYMFGLPLLPHTLSFWIKSGIDKLYVTNYVSISDTGVYSFAETLTVIFSMVMTAFFSAYTPHLFKTLAGLDKHEDAAYVKTQKGELVDQVKYFLIAYFSILFLSYFVLSFLIKEFYLEQYGGALAYFHYMVIGASFPAIYALFSAYLFYQKKTKLLGTITFMSAIIHTGINFIIVQKYQVEGMVITNMILSLVMTLFVAFYANKTYAMPWSRLLKYKIPSI